MIEESLEATTSTSMHKCQMAHAKFFNNTKSSDVKHQQMYVWNDTTTTKKPTTNFYYMCMYFYYYYGLNIITQKYTKRNAHTQTKCLNMRVLIKFQIIPKICRLYCVLCQNCMSIAPISFCTRINSYCIWFTWVQEVLVYGKN